MPDNAWVNRSVGRVDLLGPVTTNCAPAVTGIVARIGVISAAEWAGTQNAQQFAASEPHRPARL